MQSRDRERERERKRKERRREEADGFLRRCVYFAGLPDPYVKITVDKMKFKTSIKRQTLHPVWHELFRIRICSWNLPSKILLRARDRDSFGKDDELVKTPDQSICSPVLFNYF
jgi:Ca2+-dependent lipid-binding protein